jgi:stress response protein YsnF
MAQTVIGFFDDQTEAQRAIEQLQSSGFNRDRIDLSRGNSGTTAGMSGSTTTTGTTNPVSGSERDENSVRRTSDERTVDEAGRNTNKFTDFFNNLFGSNKNDADRYSHVAERSGAIVTVHAQSREEAERAADILDDCGAVDVDERSAQYGFANTRSAEGIGERENISNDRGTTIPRIEENLEVGKREVERGGIRLRSRIVEQPVEEHVRLREEHVHVERQPVNRPVSDADMRNFKEGDIELTERSEVPVVNKEARVVEEVKLNKDVTERDETIRDTVRNTDIDIDRLDSGNRSTGNDLNDDLTNSARPRTT